MPLAAFKDGSYAAGSRGYLSMRRPEENFREGLCWTPYGFVLIWQDTNPRRRSTKLLMIRGGRVHHRDWDEVWSDRTLKRLAREFAEQVVQRA